MSDPEDDFDDEFEDDDLIEISADENEDGDGDDNIPETASSGTKQYDTRRKIEDMLERKRLREEFGDLDFEL